MKGIMFKRQLPSAGVPHAQQGPQIMCYSDLPGKTKPAGFQRHQNTGHAC